MNIQKSQKASKKLLKIISLATTGAFLSCLMPVLFSQPAMSQDNAPASQTSGGARADEAGGFANPTTRTNDPSLSTPGNNSSTQDNMRQMNGSTMMNNSNSNYSSMESYLENYENNLTGRDRNTIKISQWPKNRIERYTFPNSTNPDIRVDGTNYLSVTPEGSTSQNSAYSNDMNMGTGSGAGGVSGQMNQMNQNQMRDYNSPAPGNTVAPSGGRINDQLAPNNMQNRSNYDSPNVRSQQMNESSGIGGGTGGQNSFGQANDRMNNQQYNSDGSTMQQMNPNNSTGLGGGTGGQNSFGQGNDRMNNQQYNNNGSTTQQMTPNNTTGVGGGTGGGRADEFGGQTQQRTRVDDPSVSAPEVQNNSGQSNTQMNNSNTQNGNTTSPDTGTGSGAGGVGVPGLW